MAISARGFVLVGGTSRRFGSDKALAMHRGQPLVAWAVRALRELGVPVKLVGPDLEAYQQWCRQGLSDEKLGLGPAEGVRVALQDVPNDWALILSVDMPGVTAEVLRPLLAAAHANPDAQIICYVHPPSQRHPFPGLYHSSLLEVIASEGRGGSLLHLLDTARTHLVASHQLDQCASTTRVPFQLDDVLRNVNRPVDLGD